MYKHFLTSLILISTAGCIPKDAEAPKSWKPTWNGEVRKFSSCLEMDMYFARFNGPGPAMPIGLPLSGSTPNQAYANQVDGVNEGDILQSNEDYFFFARKGSIEIVQRNNMTLRKSIPIDHQKSFSLLVQQKKLIAIGTDGANSSLVIFDIDKDFLQVYQKQLNAQTIDYRVVGQKIVLVTQNNSHNTGPLPVPCESIYRPNLEDGSRNTTFVTVVEFGSENYNETNTGFLGDVDFIYLTQSDLYLFKNNVPWYGDVGMPPYIRALSWDNSSGHPAQVVSYEGIVKDRWSVTEYGDRLMVATTVSGSTFADRSNKILTFGRSEGGLLQLTHSTPPFGLHEDIRSVLYLQDKAYVVTFQKTDPLFVFDVRNPDDIKLLSELKSPGFSTQLRPLKEGFLGGLGYHTISATDFSWFDAIKFSVFDLTDPLNPTESATLKWGERGTYSEATGEPKALYISENKKRIYFPLVVVKKIENGWDGDVGRNFLYSGLKILGLENNKLLDLGLITHREWITTACGPQFYFPISWWNQHNTSIDVQRSVEVGDSIYTFSRFGIMKSNLNTLVTSDKLKFQLTPHLCTYR